MKYFDYTIQNPIGPHARPIDNLIMTARTWQPGIILEKGEKTVNPKSLTSALALNVNQGDAIRITTTGVDEEEATAGVEEPVEKNLQIAGNDGRP